MSKILGVEIFACGLHNGEKYDEHDLDQIAHASRHLDYRPAIKIGHTRDEPGAPAYGWVENVRVVGRKLVADLVDMHESVVNAIRKHHYSQVSAEIYFNLKRDGHLWPRALKAVALLGAEVPAVANLVPLHKMQFSAHGIEVGNGGAQQLAASFVSDREERVATYRQRQIDRADAGARVHELVVAWMEKNPGKDYTDGLTAILRRHPDLASRYRGISIDGDWQPSQWERDRA